MRHWNELINQVRDWAEERNITTGGGTGLGQAKKSNEEVMELMLAIEQNRAEDVKDAVGDILVTLIIQCEFWDFTLEDALEHAWEQIKDRRGTMINGQFVKEGDAPPAVIHEEESDGYHD